MASLYGHTKISMNKLKKMAESIFDFLEVAIPTISLVVLFVTYIVVIIYRYIFKTSILWMSELSTFAYMWGAVFAASYGSRKNTNVSFTIVYDKLTEKMQRIIRIIGNTIISVIFFVLIRYTYESVSFMNIKKSPVLKIPFGYVFFPFLVFVILTLIHHFIDLISDIKDVFRGRKENTKV